MANWPSMWPGGVYGWVLQLVYGSDGQTDVTKTCCWNQKLMYDDYREDPPDPSKQTMP